MRKTICLVTDWYPTKENPIRGCFFKEQAISLSDSFDFVIFRYHEKYSFNPFKKDVFFLSNKEENTTEYVAETYISPLVLLCDFITTFYKRYVIKLPSDGVGVYVSERKKRHTNRKINKLSEKISESIDAFYCIDAQKEAYRVQCLAKRYKKPYIVGEHGPIPWPIDDINKKAIESADLFFAISKDKIRQLIRNNIKLPKTVYVGNLIDEEKMIIDSERAPIKTFIIVAAHSYYKNYDHFISVMETLKEITEEEFRIKIVGYGANKGYSRNSEVLEEKIKKSKISDITEMIPEVPRENISKIYNSAHAFVMTSIQEGQPVSAMEAACCGLPIFSTMCGGVEDYVDDRVGRIFELNDVLGMAEGLKDYLENRITFDSNEIRSKVVDIFGKKAFCQRMTDAFNSVIIDEND